MSEKFELDHHYSCCLWDDMLWLVNGNKNRETSKSGQTPIILLPNYHKHEERWKRDTSFHWPPFITIKFYISNWSAW